MGLGYLTVKASLSDEAVPVKGATVIIRDQNENDLYRMITDSSGSTDKVALQAPDKKYSLDESFRGVPYSTYQVEVSQPGFVTKTFNGVQIFDTVESVETVNMQPAVAGERTEEVIDIAPHKQVQNLPQNQPGSTRALVGQPGRRVIIPQSITVHLGRYNQSARNITVPFPLYIKNVASSEIYPDWPTASLEANIRAIINFALNRVYTEWYRSRGYPFDITSSTTTDMYFVEGRNIFTSISLIVDRVIGEYLRRSNHFEPFFTEFCDGRTVSCPGMSQWGTVTLAKAGIIINHPINPHSI
ncbi:MAG: hypothetical protein FWH04_00870 [Oscillospiraceae bacterium]|nr:hypothetical protein [Oscillospiraceae bacterium]